MLNHRSIVHRANPHPNPLPEYRARGNTVPASLALLTMIALGMPSLSSAAPPPGMILKTENFNVDPNWHGHNNRAAFPPATPISQSFGYSPSTGRAGGPAGEIGGTVFVAAEPAYYAKDIGTQTLADPFSVSGTLNVAGQGQAMLGFFNSTNVNEWRTPDSLLLRFENQGGQQFFVHPEYGTSKWRASATGFPNTFAGGTTVHNFSFEYDGAGTYTTTFDGQTAVGTIGPEHLGDGATFNRFGLLNVMKHAQASAVVAVDNLVINGVAEDFSDDPGWEGFQNRRNYLTTDIRPKFNFGYSATSHAGGQASGEMGGLIFRGESDDPSLMAYYGDRLEQTLTLDDPLHASGKVSFHRGVTDSASLIGFFNSTESIRVGFSDYSTPENFLGAGIEGPTAEGFFFYPSFNANIEDGNEGTPAPYIYPNRDSHEWTLDYDPNGGPNGFGRITLSLDGQISTLDLDSGDRAAGATFDRFGMITPQKSGNGQRIFYDDLTYTVGVPEPSGVACILTAASLLLGRRRVRRAPRVAAACLFATTFLCTASIDSAAHAQTLLKTETFDVDPNWDGHNNRATTPAPQQVTQNFGFSASTKIAGGAFGEVGGFITPAAEPAYYGKVLPDLTFDDPFTVSGNLAVQNGGGHTLIGLFNSNTVNEWRTPNTIALRIYGRGSYFYASPEMATSKWRAGASFFPGPNGEYEFPTGLITVVHPFSLSYNPTGAGGLGEITATIDNQTSGFTIAPSVRADGAVFNRFGFLNVMKSVDSAGRIWLDNLTINGQSETFDADPNWEGFNNQTTWTTTLVRPRFDFGYSGGTNNAGGASPGEMGGVVWRGDSDTPGGVHMAYYGDPLQQTLDLSHPLHAHGKVALHRGVSDSATIIGFFHSTDSIREGVSDYATPENFIGAAIEGPSSEGFFFYPTFMTNVEDGHSDGVGTFPYIYPDGESREWTLDYDPNGGSGYGRITVGLDGQTTFIDLKSGDRAAGAHFDRFGIITTHADGLSQTVYFDDLTYTVGVPEPGGAAAACLVAAASLKRRRRRRGAILASVVPIVAMSAVASQRADAQMILKTENFNTDPGWHGHNNRATSPPPVTIFQNFGYSNSTSNAGGPAGEVGGLITPAGEAAYYAKIISPLSLDEPLLASGTLNVREQGHTLLGFFNADTVNEWRTPNAVSLRLYGRDTHFEAHADYATSKWRAGGAAFSSTFPIGVHNWSLQYDPAANNGNGRVTGVIGGQTVITNLEPGHKADGATFNRFGLLNVVKAYDGRGQVWIDNLNINGVTDTFSTDPGWSGLRNKGGYVTTNVRPRFDFGHSPSTNYAGGAAPGELGGNTFRGDSRSAERMAFYGDELDQTLTTDNPLRASGKVAFRRGVSDSTTLIGFFHSTDSVRVSPSQAAHVPENFIGIGIEGPSREGFLFYGAYGTDAEGIASRERGNNPPYIYPDGSVHDWTLDYDPAGNGGFGRISVTLDGQLTTVDLPADHRAIGGHFDRFGMITTHVDGNGQTVFFDDLTYTIAIPEPAAAGFAAVAVMLLRRRRRAAEEK